MKLNPQISLAFDGQCEAAFRFYQRCLNGTIAFMMMWRESPMAADAPPGSEDKIFHATLNVGATVIMGSDVPADRYEAPKGFSIVLQMDDAIAAERAFHALAANGTVAMPLQETFWASRFASFTDQFGVPWTINCEKSTQPA